MTTTPTLDAERTGQLRTFLVTEAAADAAATAAVRRPHRTRVRVGVAATLLLAGAITVGTSLSGTGSQRADAVAIEQVDGWTTVRLIDIDADPQAVVDELHAAGIDARVGDADEVADGTSADGVTGMSAESLDGSFGVGMISAVPDGDALEAYVPNEGDDPVEVEVGSGVVGEAEVDPEVGTTAPIPGGGTESAVPAADAIDDQLEDAGIRFGDGDEISIRNDAEVRVVVYRG